MSKQKKKKKGHRHKVVCTSKRFLVEVCKEGYKENDPICITVVAESGKKAHHHFTYEQASGFIMHIQRAMELVSK